MIFLVSQNNINLLAISFKLGFKSVGRKKYDEGVV